MPQNYMSRYSCKIETKFPKGFLTEIVKRSLSEGLTPKEIKSKYNITHSQWKSASRTIKNDKKT
jgi:hypothetical protein